MITVHLDRWWAFVGKMWARSLARALRQRMSGRTSSVAVGAPQRAVSPGEAYGHRTICAPASAWLGPSYAHEDRLAGKAAKRNDQ